MPNNNKAFQYLNIVSTARIALSYGNEEDSLKHIAVGAVLKILII